MESSSHQRQVGPLAPLRDRHQLESPRKGARRRAMPVVDVGGEPLQRRAPPRRAGAQGRGLRRHVQLSGLMRIAHAHAAHPVIGRIGDLRALEGLQQFQALDLGVVAFVGRRHVAVVVPVAEIAAEIDVTARIGAAVVEAQAGAMIALELILLGAGFRRHRAQARAIPVQRISTGHRTRRACLAAAPAGRRASAPAECRAA